MAHRGAWADGAIGGTGVPENSRAAMENAFNLGVWMIETDMQFSKDGKIVINHDASFKGHTIANTNYYGDGGLHELTLSNGETLPLLEEFLDIMETSPNDTTKYLLEIKNTDCIESAVEMVFDRGLEDRCWWTSFSDGTNGIIRNLYATRGKTACVNLSVYGAPDYSKLSPSTTKSFGVYKTIPYSVMKDAVSKGYDVNYWPVDTESEMKDCMKEYVPTICTNYSRRLINLKESLKSE